MLNIREMRNSMDSKLDQWEHSALAIEAQFQSTKDEALRRVESQKKKMSAAAARIQQAIQKSAQIPGEAKQEIKSEIDKLQLQLALGKAEARDAYQQQEKAIMDGIAGVEARIARHETELDREWEAAMAEWIREEIALEAELEAAHIQYEMEKAERRAEFAAKKQEIASQINAYRETIADKRRMASDKLGTFEGELSAGMDQIKQAFSNLMSS
ncbi:MAG: hypothetical protein OEQ39_21265 [Gammaproteobacteria bacterium]|nr:hypothetical protein [Gammaproteobacteria bacterium]MDH3466083.1 hypothetical protein [Gammaproteobacteria bacterium]